MLNGPTAKNQLRPMFTGRNSKTSFKLSYKPPLSRQEILCFGLWSPSEQNHFKNLQLETIQNHSLIFKDVLNFLISFNCNFIMVSIYFIKFSNQSKMYEGDAYVIHSL